MQPRIHYPARITFKIEGEIPYDPTITLLDIYPDKTLLKRDTCTCMFIAALFTIVRTWKQPKCPSTDDQIRKKWYIYTMEYYSAIKKNEIMLFAATWMELETLILSEVSQKDKAKYHMISLYLESNIRHKGTFPQKGKSWIQRIDLWLPRGRGREWGGWVAWG